MKHQTFKNQYNGNVVSYCTVTNVPAMRVDSVGNTIVVVITKEEAMRFFNLVDAPEPKKPVHADLIKAFTEGAEIQYQYCDWQPHTWEPLYPDSDDQDKYALLAFMGHKKNPEWSFRIKPE